MKTIEEAEYEYAKMCSVDMEGYEAIRQAFLSGANHIMSLPLADRLTADEREKMVNLYRESDKCYKSCSNSINNNQTAALDNIHKSGINKGVMLALKYIFGKEMFEEKGGSDE